MLFEDLHINNGDTKVWPSFLILTADTVLFSKPLGGADQTL